MRSWNEGPPHELRQVCASNEVLSQLRYPSQVKRTTRRGLTRERALPCERALTPLKNARRQGTHAAKEHTPPRNTRRPRTMLRAATSLARAGSRRGLHSGSDFLGLSVPASLGCRHGMDMSRAPGYEVAADDEPPLIGNRRLADFAARHSRLSAGQMAHADGYLWVGHVIYPTGPETEPAVSWEISYVEPDAEVEELAKALEEAIKPAVEAKRRYSGGQARRLREQREDSAARKGAKRTKKRPQRKVKNDIPRQDDDPVDETPA